MRCDAKLLHGALSSVARFIPGRSVIPAIMGVKIQVADGELVATATNLTATAISKPLPVQCGFNEEFSIVAPKSVIEFLGTVTGEIEVNVDDAKIHIKAQGANGRYPYWRAEEFPVIKADVESWVTVPANTLDKITFAAAADESNRVLTAVNFLFNDGKLNLQAADGYRLAFTSVDADGKGDYNIPAVVVKELGKDGFRVGFSDWQGHNAVFETDGLTIISQLIDGNFPDVKRITPNEHKVKVTVNVADLKQALKRAETFKPENNNIHISISADQLEISAISAENGDGKSMVHCESTGNLEINFNYGFFKDSVYAVTAAKITLLFTESNRPGLVRDENNPAWGYVVMPMHMGNK